MSVGLRAAWLRHTLTRENGVSTVSAAEVRVGTAGWTLPRGADPYFPKGQGHLERYAQVLNAVEINSTFYKLPQSGTFERWRDSTPASFRFSVKIPGAITHDAGLRAVGRQLTDFLTLVSGLGPKLGALLVQLPPKLEFQPAVARAFVRRLRSAHPGDVVWEPRHPSWFAAPAGELLLEYGMARVDADPPPCPVGDSPTALGRVLYHRLHGSPRMYYSEYSNAQLDALAARFRALMTPSPRRRLRLWCMFDNTAHGAALPNALELISKLRAAPAS